MVEMGQYASAMDFRREADAERSVCNRESLQTLASGIASLDRRAILTRTVELDVIPALLRRGLVARMPAPLTPVPLPLVSPTQVTELAELTLRAQEPAAGDFVTAMLDLGFRAEALYLDLLAPAARQLGDWWLQDVCDFTEVTVGLWKLESAMRDLGPAFLGPDYLTAEGRRVGPRAILVPLPGEQHTFGLSMVYDFFRRAGWNAWSGAIESRAALATMVRRQWVDIVGFSLACDERLDSARAEIRAVRRASRNRGLAVLVGGPPFTERPGLAAEIGADGTAENGLQAVAAAQGLLACRHERG